MSGGSHSCGSLDWNAWFCPDPLARLLYHPPWLAGVQQPTKGTVHLNDGQFVSSFPCLLLLPPLPMSGNVHLKAVFSLHPLWLSPTASQSHLHFSVYSDAKQKVSLRIREIRISQPQDY